VRAAIYARKSTEKGLEQEFTSIDSQVEACRNYIASQRESGWLEVGEPYTDPGFSAATLNRPAIRRLIVAVEAGELDVVVAYRMDRLSRRQLDLLNLLDLFERKGVRFISVTEPFTTATPIGRAMISLLGVFAQMERETIAERIKDKMGAARRRGMWQGGAPVYGYDVVDKKLVANEDEAAVVREIFEMFLRVGTLTGTLAELRRRGIRNKRWTSAKGREAGGGPFNRDSLRKLLSNAYLIGKVPVNGEEVPGEHTAIVPDALWNQVQAALAANDGGPKRVPRAESGAMLQALLVCAVCGSAMTPAHTLKKGRRYSYYCCTKVRKHGAAACRGSRVAAGEIEAELIGYLRQVARNPAVIAATVKAARREARAERERLSAELRRHEADVRRLHAERERLGQAIARGGPAALADRLAEVERDDALTAQRIAEVRAEIDRLAADALDEHALREVLLAFDPVWAELGPPERARALATLLERVTYDGRTGVVTPAFLGGGVRALLKGAS
jgi:site-specific DNA recombinase